MSKITKNKIEATQNKIVVCFTIDRKIIETIDEIRGDIKRSTYVNSILKKNVNN